MWHNVVGCMVGYGVVVGVRWVIRKCRGKDGIADKHPLNL